MSWSTNWPTNVNPEVSFGVGVLVEGVVCVLRGGGTAGVGGRLLFHGRTQAVERRIQRGVGRLALEHEAEATLGRRALGHQVHPAQLGAVGWDGRRRSAAAGAIWAAHAVPSEAVAAVPSEATAVPFRKRRRLKPRARFSDIFSPDSSVDLPSTLWHKAKPSRVWRGPVKAD